MFHWGKWKKRMGANSSSKRPVFDEKEDGKRAGKVNSETALRIFDYFMVAVKLAAKLAKLYYYYYLLAI